MHPKSQSKLGCCEGCFCPKEQIEIRQHPPWSRMAGWNTECLTDAKSHQSAHTEEMMAWHRTVGNFRTTSSWVVLLTQIFTYRCSGTGSQICWILSLCKALHFTVIPHQVFPQLSSSMTFRIPIQLTPELWLLGVELHIKSAVHHMGGEQIHIVGLWWSSNRICLKFFLN